MEKNNFLNMGFSKQPSVLIPNYRPDIDGLRAIAVIAVILFHAFPTMLPGGFVGVDIFFVLSGYLITGLLIRENAEGNLKLRTFYARRIKRIFPALLLVLICGLVAGWIFFTSEEYYNLGKYTAGGAAFLNNFMFWKAAGYFDSAANTKPLLHLWSLAIEEQFYLIWPLILIAIFRWLKIKTLPLLIMFSSSLLYSLWTVNTDSVKDFYSPLTRFWELIIGGILAFELSKNYLHNTKALKYAAHFGLVLIIISFLFIRSEYNFPGYLALIPTIGAVLIIFSGNNSWINRSILSSVPFVWIGLISYPLYLWHWPLLVFVRIVNSEIPSISVRIFLLALSILLAWLTFVFIERPIRFYSKSKFVTPILCFLMIVVLFTGHFINVNNGFGFRNYSMLNADPSTMVIGADRTKLKKECNIDHEKMHLFPWCMSDVKPDAHSHYAVLGDSKGESLFYGLSRESDQDHGWRMLGPVNPSQGEASPNNQAAYESVEKDERIKAVIFANALRNLFPINSKTGFIENKISLDEINRKVLIYTEIIKRFSKTGKKSIFVIDNPTFPDPNDCIGGGLTSNEFLNKFLYRKENSLCRLNYSDHLKGTLPYQIFIKNLKQENPDLIIFDPSYLLCNLPENTCITTENNKFLYSYGDHISDYSSSKIAKILLPIIFNEQIRN